MTSVDRELSSRGKYRSAVAVLVAGIFLSLLLTMAARAQSAPYNPYVNQSAPFDTYGNPGAYTGQAGSAGATENGAGAQSGAVSQGASSSQPFGPTIIAAPIDPRIPEGATTQVVTPAAGPAPLYARPTSTPGQFELFTRPPPPPSEFEAFVAKTLGRSLHRFGASLVTGASKGFAVPPTTTIPPDYILNPGDELVIGVTGSVEAVLRLVIDPEGRIFVPRIGAINVAGARYGDLAEALARRFSEQYKQARLSVSIGHLHGMTIYVTGYAVSPGAYTVSSLSTMVDAVLAAGGPAAGGSFRDIELRRNGQIITDLDLYDLLLRGDKTHDAVLRNDDVLNIAPVGPELAVTGSVNAEAIYEAKPGETLADVIRFAGGLNSLADDTRLIVARLGDLDLTGSRKLTFAQARTFPAERGDIVRVLSLGDIARPMERQAILATIDGEVDHPGRFYLQPGATLGDLLARAGGLTSGAFVFGANFARESVRAQQQVSYDTALDDLSLDAVASPLQSLNGTADKAASSQARLQAVLAVVDRLKQRKPDGRIVLDLPYGASTLPADLSLENFDTINIPAAPKTVGVFGAVYQPGSFLIAGARRIDDYLKLAGGPKRIADKGTIFVVRANGAVISITQTHDLRRQLALPGDVIFVPVRTSPTAFEKLRDISTVVYQLGVGAATLGILAAQF
ncbi:MAG: SLBB domain-containing protein [Caulobacteraceae bacterium]